MCRCEFVQVASLGGCLILANAQNLELGPAVDRISATWLNE